MKDQRTQQMVQRHTRLATAPFTNPGHRGPAQQLLPKDQEIPAPYDILNPGSRILSGSPSLRVPPISISTPGMLSHSKGKYLSPKKVQGKSTPQDEFAKGIGLNPHIS
jgi:hypothetical protein